MRVLVLSDRVSADGWQSGAVVAALCAELVAAGHQVTLVCEAAEDGVALAAAGIDVAELSIFCYRTRMGSRALQRGLYAQLSSRAAEHDVVLSCSWLVAPSGGVWLPLGSAALLLLTQARVLKRVARGASGLPRMVCTDAVYADAKALPGLVVRAMAERRAIAGVLAAGTATGSVTTLLVSSRSAQREAEQLFAEGGQLDGQLIVRSRVVPPLSLLAKGAATRVAEQRAQVRALFDIAPAEPVGLVPMLARTDAVTMAMLRGLLLAAADRDDVARPTVLTLLIVSPDPFAVQTAWAQVCAERGGGAVGLGVAARVVVAAPTASFAAMLAACDFVVSLRGAAEDGLWSGSCQRLVADAMRASRPQLVRAGSAGAELIGPVAERAAGIVVDDEAPADEVLAWRDGFVQVSDPSRRVACGVAARATCDLMGLARSATLEAVERCLAEHAATAAG